jgi:hypothetical protein
MSVQSRDLHAVHARSPALRISLPSLIGLIALLCAMGATYLLVGAVVSVGQRWFDDLHYGLPRTTHLSGFVGHEESNGQPSHFIGLNLDRQIIVLQMPGGKSENVRVLPGPYLFGAGQEFTPVDLALRDMDDDSNVDLLITARNEQIVYLNREGTFRLPTSQEQHLLSDP